MKCITEIKEFQLLIDTTFRVNVYTISTLSLPLLHYRCQ